MSAKQPKEAGADAPAEEIGTEAAPKNEALSDDDLGTVTGGYTGIIQGMYNAALRAEANAKAQEGDG